MKACNCTNKNWHLVCDSCGGNLPSCLDCTDTERRLKEALAEIEKLNKNHSDALDTILAMLIAARGEECDLETLKREMNAVSTKPSGYIRHCIAERDKLIEQMREALIVADSLVTSLIDTHVDRCASVYDFDRNIIKAALSAAERINK